MFCPKCGNNLPDGATFCGKCGNQLAQARPAAHARPMARAQAGAARSGYAAAPAAGAANASGGSLMPVLRVVLAVIVLAMMFCPWLVRTETYSGMITGTTSSSESVSFASSADGLEMLWYVVPLLVIVVGVVMELAAKSRAGRWVSLVGFIVLVGLSLLVIIGGAYLISGQNQSVNVYVAQASRTYALGFGVWGCVIASAVGAVTCFIKR